MSENDSSYLEGIGGGLGTDRITLDLGTLYLLLLFSITKILGVTEAVVDDEVFVEGDILPIRMLHYINKHDGLLLGGSTGVNLVGMHNLSMLHILNY